MDFNSGSLSARAEGAGASYGGTAIGTVTTISGGTLVLTFGVGATRALVDSALQAIAYSNSSDAPPASVQIDWSFDDGNAAAQGSGGALTDSGYTIVDITSANDAPVLGTDADRADPTTRRPGDLTS